MLTVREAIQDPKASTGRQAILDLGSDSRYYVMVRGWLAMPLQEDLSILDANKHEVSPDILERVTCLKEAIRAIDLE